MEIVHEKTVIELNEEEFCHLKGILNASCSVLNDAVRRQIIPIEYIDFEKHEIPKLRDFVERLLGEL